MQINNFIAALCVAYAASAAAAPSPEEAQSNSAVGPAGNPPCYNDNYLESCCDGPYSNGNAWGANCVKYSANAYPPALCGGTRQCCPKFKDNPTVPDPNVFCVPVQTSWGEE
ncbi:hypothetical protein Tdes44962_MAKER05613 [Teratosphaeria destructans]|uniref:Uncharacterized protein n=1 Tax=Teratosphaeria destructans TaxID=418781 RepID=A0A9W7SJT3_9PEZI|nr:hypothetical protein Tdes44962_MAKER05613 [Teratosphaeria destructans]